MYLRRSYIIYQTMDKITKQSIIAAHDRIRPYIHRTPILSNKTIANMAGCAEFHLKCENFQKVGAFKPRGAFNKILQLENVSSVCTHSSGNHAQAVAYVASIFKIPAYIVMPQNSPSIKKEGVKGYGGNVIQSGNTLKDREETLNIVAQKYKSTMVHPYNDVAIVQGQATAAKEVFQDMNDLDYLVFPIGGGGLSSGSCLSTEFFGGKCKPIGVEPYLARDAKQSLIKGSLQPQMPPVTIADGLRTSLGQITFGILSHYLKPEDVILVEEEEIISAMRLVFERMKIVIEPSCATVVAAVLKDPRFKDKKVCCIISGGNVDMSVFFDLLNSKVKS